MSSPEHKQKIWNMIKDIKTGMLVTEDGDSLRSRPMTIVQEDYDGTLWFFTSSSSGKAGEIENDKKVCISFCNHDDDIHISLSGRAKLTRDRNLIEKFWNPFVAAWFPKGKDDPDIALLEIKIQMGEHWHAKDSKAVQLYEILKANIGDQTPDLGEHERFGTTTRTARQR